MTAAEVVERRAKGLDASDVIDKSPNLGRAIQAIETGAFSPDDPGRYASVGHALRHLDHYVVSADFDSYYEAQRGIDTRWRAGSAWSRAAILNTARMGWFSSDRTIREYADDIWGVPVAGDCRARQACRRARRRERGGTHARNATSTAPQAIRMTPSQFGSDNFSPRNKTANIATNTTLSLSIGATCAALPSLSARK